MKTKLILLIFLLILMLGCTTRQSEFSLCNECSTTLDFKINGDPISLAPHQSYDDTVLLDEFIFFKETKKYVISYDGYVYLAKGKKDITLEPDEDKEYILRNNRAGIRIINQSGIPISGIYLRKIDEDDWSENYLEEIEIHNDFNISAKENQVDLKLIDATNREFVLNDTITLQIGSSADVFFDNFYLYYFGE